MSKSERRQRTRFLAIRLDDAEENWLLAESLRAHVTKSEMARALIFDRMPAPPVVPCSSAHAVCNAQHREVVDGYRDQRAREELEVESETGNYRGDLELRKANGGVMVTFKGWLQAHRRTDSDSEAS